MSIFGLQTNGFYIVHANDATGHEGFQEVLYCCHHGKNKERLAKLIASELRGSDESEDEGAVNMSFKHCDLSGGGLGLVQMQIPNLFGLRHSFNTR